MYRVPFQPSHSPLLRYLSTLFNPSHPRPPRRHQSGTEYPRTLVVEPAVIPPPHRGRCCWLPVLALARVPSPPVRIQPRHFSVWMAVPFGINSTSVKLRSKGFLTRPPYYNHGYPSNLPYITGPVSSRPRNASQSIDPAILSVGTPSNLYNI